MKPRVSCHRTIVVGNGEVSEVYREISFLSRYSFIFFDGSDSVGIRPKWNSGTPHRTNSPIHRHSA